MKIKTRKGKWLISAVLFWLAFAPLAEEQVKVFESMRLKALGAPAGEAIECLDYVRNYYPSGTKQAVGSRLDNIVESARGAATREIIAHLRIKTGKDFGDDPSKWKATEIHN